jgi:hypothetical protein
VGAYPGSLDRRGKGEPRPGPDVTGVSGERIPGADGGRDEPSPGADVGGMSPVLEQMWEG